MNAATNHSTIRSTHDQMGRPGHPATAARVYPRGRLHIDDIEPLDELQPGGGDDPAGRKPALACSPTEPTLAGSPITVIIRRKFGRVATSHLLCHPLLACSLGADILARVDPVLGGEPIARAVAEPAEIRAAESTGRIDGHQPAPVAAGHHSIVLAVRSLTAKASLISPPTGRRLPLARRPGTNVPTLSFAITILTYVVRLWCAAASGGATRSRSRCDAELGPAARP